MRNKINWIGCSHALGTRDHDKSLLYNSQLPALQAASFSAENNANSMTSSGYHSNCHSAESNTLRPDSHRIHRSSCWKMVEVAKVMTSESNANSMTSSGHHSNCHSAESNTLRPDSHRIHRSSSHKDSWKMMEVVKVTTSESNANSMTSSGHHSNCHSVESNTLRPDSHRIHRSSCLMLTLAALWLDLQRHELQMRSP